MLIYRNGKLAVHRLLLNELKTNCFLIQHGQEALLVDPTDQADQIIAYLGAHGLQLRHMLTTHGHFDHVSGAAGMVESGLVDTLYLHEKDFDEIKRAKTYSLMIFKKKMALPPMAHYSEELLGFLRGWGLGLRHVGGHTRGSSYLYGLDHDFIISGDLTLHHKLTITLFDSRENTAEFQQFIDQVQQQFRPDTVILPGHGDATTVAAELEYNKKWAYVQHKESKRSHGN